MTTRARTWPFSPRRILSVASDWAGDRIARLLDRSLSWVDSHLPEHALALPAVRRTYEMPPAEPSAWRSEPQAPAAAEVPAVAAAAAERPEAGPTTAAACAPVLQAWIAALEQGVDSPAEPADVHRVRVCCRRLRTFVADLKLAEIGPARGLERPLRSCSRAFAEVRECDAELERLRAHPIGGTHAIAVRLEKRIGKRRTAAVAALQRQRERLGIPELAGRLHACVDALASAADEPPPWVDAIVSARVDALRASVPTVVAADQLEVLHRIRVRAKQLRYTLRWLGELGPAHARRWRALAKRLQRALGQHREAALFHAHLVQRHARAHAKGRTADVEALTDAIVASRRACATAFAPIPGLLARVRQ